MTGKDSFETVTFMALFSKLRDWIDDEPSGLDSLAAEDEKVRKLCVEVFDAAREIAAPRVEHFAAPVDLKFIDAWRTYEHCYQERVGEIWLCEMLGIEPGPSTKDTASKTSSKEGGLSLHWERAANMALMWADNMRRALTFAKAQFECEEEYLDSPDEIEEGMTKWEQFLATGTDVEGTLRRRELIPFVLIPRHVAKHHGSKEKLSIYNYLRQAHGAFVYGAPYAALALMRSLLEIVLREHYRASGEKLSELIDNAKTLPRGANRRSLHRLRLLANKVLHSGPIEREMVRVPASEQEWDWEIVSFLTVLRCLIEETPET